VDKSTTLQAYLGSIFGNIADIHWPTVGMSLFWICLLLGMKRAASHHKGLKWLKAAGPLTVTVLGTLITFAGRLDKELDIRVVGSIPDGLPRPSADFNFSEGGTLVTSALIVCFVGFIESFAIAEAMSQRHGYKVDANQELLGLGLSNVFGSFFGAYPVTGSFSRTAVNNEAGARTHLAGVVSSLLIMLTLLFLTPLFYYLPNSVLGAIVISAVIGLVELREAQHLYRTAREDFGVWLAAFCGVLFLGVEVGIALAIGLSLALVIYSVARPHVAVLGAIPGTQVYRDITQYPGAEVSEGVLVFRLDAPLFFANSYFFQDKLIEMETAMFCAYRHSKTGVRGVVHYVVLAMGPMTSIDATGMHLLAEVARSYKARGVQLVLSNPSASVVTSLLKSDIIDIVGREWVFYSPHEAVEVCRDRLRGLTEPRVSTLPVGCKTTESGRCRACEEITHPALKALQKRAVRAGAFPTAENGHADWGSTDGGSDPPAGPR